jgi:hypothetical protein
VAPDNIKMDLKETGYEGVGWIYDGNEWQAYKPYGSIKGGKSLDHLSDY